MWWLRLTAGVLFLIGGWQTAIGLRPGEGAATGGGGGVFGIGGWLQPRAGADIIILSLTPSAAGATKHGCSAAEGI